jgi:hypothetical protein
MGDPSDADDRPPTVITLGDEREREHARRNARQGEMLRHAIERQRHQAYVERARLSMEQDKSS